MSSVCNFVSTALYNRFSQCRSIQKLAVGVECLSQGGRLLRDPDPSPAPSLIRKIGRKVAGIALLIGGLAELSCAGQALATAPIHRLKLEFLFGQNPTAPIEEDPYEQAFKRSPERLSEVLYLAAGAIADHNGALDPLNPGSLPRCLNSKTKLKYKTIRHPLQICEEIQSTSKSGLVQELIIDAHGSINAMKLSPTSLFRIFDRLPANCFDGLAPGARIFIKSCSTGENSLWRPSFAEWISWISGREVIAAAGPVTKAACGIVQRRLNIWLQGPPVNSQGELLFSAPSIDYTTRFNTSTSWTETALFSVKMVAPTIFGAMTTWKSMRLGATVLQGSGAAAEWLVDKSAAPIKRLAERVGWYNPDTAQVLYTTTKWTSQMLNGTGKAVHQAMDKLIQPVSSLGSWVFGKSITAATTMAQTLYGKIRRS